MTCAACAARVEKKLNAIADVTAVVDLATERASVTAPPAISAQRLSTGSVIPPAPPTGRQ